LNPQDHAKMALEEGRFGEAVDEYLQILSSPLPDAERPHVMSHLAEVTLGTLLLIMFEDEIVPTSSGDLFWDALESLDRAASLYEELGLIDTYTCLLTIAQGFRFVEEIGRADGVYARIARELNRNRL
jgi:hypothetical protein